MKTWSVETETWHFAPSPESRGTFAARYGTFGIPGVPANLQSDSESEGHYAEQRPSVAFSEGHSGPQCHLRPNQGRNIGSYSLLFTSQKNGLVCTIFLTTPVCLPFLLLGCVLTELPVYPSFRIAVSFIQEREYFQPSLKA